MKKPIPRQKANKIPTGNLIDSSVNSLRVMGVMFWIEKTAIVMIQPATIEAAMKLVIVFIFSQLYQRIYIRLLLL